jgi:sugar (pentulose or hexulose) kinase
MGLSGGTLNYFENLLQASAEKLEKEIAALPAGSNGLLIIPGLTGERAPYWKAHQSGTIAGLTPSHRSQHLLRAVMEGSGLRLKKLLKILSQSQMFPRTLNIVGGGASLDVWNQIRSDICGLQIQKLAVTEATSLGTAMFCAAGLDKDRALRDISDDWIKVAKKFSPNSENAQTYERLSRLFDKHIETNEVLYRGLTEFRR